MRVDRRQFLKYAGAAAVGAAATGLGVAAWTYLPATVSGELTVYSGRGEDLIGPLIERFRTDTGIGVQVKYGGTSEMAATILEEGSNSPADLYFAQDAGALGALANEARLRPIPVSLLERVEPRFRSRNGDWVGITGRARTVDYNVNLVVPSELPTSIWGFTDSRWAQGRLGWAPTNGSFQAFVTAFRVLEGETAARDWLEGIVANEPQVYPKNTPIVAALGAGAIHAGFVNNYYLHRFQAENPAFPVAHHYTEGDAGSMINVAGLAIVDTVSRVGVAEKFIEYMLDDDAQRYFSSETYEYPLSAGAKVLGPQRPVSEIHTPDIDLNDLWDLQGTLDLLQEVGAL